MMVPAVQELGEGTVEHVVGLVGRITPDQVDREVVGGPERRCERRGGRCGQLGEPHQRDLGAPDRDSVADGVETATSGTAGQLCVLA